MVPLKVARQGAELPRPIAASRGRPFLFSGVLQQFPQLHLCTGEGLGKSWISVTAKATWYLYHICLKTDFQRKENKILTVYLGHSIKKNKDTWGSLNPSLIFYLKVTLKC